MKRYLLFRGKTTAKISYESTYDSAILKNAIGFAMFDQDYDSVDEVKEIFANMIKKAPKGYNFPRCYRLIDSQTNDTVLYFINGEVI